MRERRVVNIIEMRREMLFGVVSVHACYIVEIYNNTSI